MIDRTLNYGRPQIEKFLRSSMPWSTVLDIGAGQGNDLLLARGVNPQGHLAALESFPPYAVKLRDLGMDVHGVDIERQAFPFPKESLDVVMANQILEHVKEIFWILHQISTALKEGGHMIIGVPNLASFHNRLLLALGRQPTCIQNKSAHVRGYTKSDFRHLLDAGFPGGYQLLGFGGGNFYPFPALVAKPLASLFPSMAWGIFMHFQKVKPYHNEFLEYPVREQLETNFFLGESLPVKVS